jgi:hypothetical protein
MNSSVPLSPGSVPQSSEIDAVVRTRHPRAALPQSPFQASEQPHFRFLARRSA